MTALPVMGAERWTGAHGDKEPREWPLHAGAPACDCASGILFGPLPLKGATLLD